ncbi:MAG: CocE/NonD family hydrolase [Alphaproteobacteria bacterium]
MMYVSEFPHRVREIVHTVIPLPDGTRLAARCWIPEDAAQTPVPALLEYLPYRKNDNTAQRDSVMHPYIAGHGYAGVRVDLRGSGESEGVLQDEYLEQELKDGVEVLRWIAAQPWCDGQVAMMGISWGGFNGLQIAARQPPELKTVITLCSTDDRYVDDVHYMGGCLLGDNLSWASNMFAYNTAPPDPDLVGDAWREMWLDRLKHSGLWLAEWLSHQHRDEYWKHGSICEDYSAIRVPVLAVSGWADAYTNAVFRLLKNLDVPRQGIVGPWSHKYPHIGSPGPAIGFLQKVVRWMDHWMKGRDTGIMDDPMLRAYLQDSSPPSTGYRHRPGRWVAEPSWPSPNVGEWVLHLARAELLDSPETGDTGPVVLRSPMTVGLFSGKWCSESAPPDLPDDQREEDGGSLIFETAELPERVELLGAPVLECEIESDRPVAMLAARLSDIRPDGAATLVTYSLLNLCHRDSHETPSALVPGNRYRVCLQLNDCGQAFPAGHRIRLSLSTVYWPHAWTTPEPVKLIFYPGSSRLILPVRPPRPEDHTLRPFAEPAGAPPIRVEQIVAPDHHWQVIRDLGRNTSVLEVLKNDGRVRYPNDLEVFMDAVERYMASHDDWHSVKGTTEWTYGFQRGDWRVHSVTGTRLSSDAKNFYLHARLDAFEGDTRIYSKNWNYTIKRDLV